MREAAQDYRFALEPFQFILVVAGCVGEELQCHQPIHVGLQCFVDDAHASRSDGAPDPVFVIEDGVIAEKHDEPIRAGDRGLLIPVS